LAAVLSTVLLIASLLLTASPVAAQGGDGQWYTVKPGDWIELIAVRFGLPERALIDANSLGNPNLIHPGQRLWVPARAGGTAPATPAVPSEPAAQPSGEGQWYVVKAGDWLELIAVRFGVNYRTLVNANSLANPNLIHIGQRIWVPGSSGEAAPAAPATPVPSAEAPSGSGEGQWYTVKRGEWLELIGARFGVSASTIALANSLSNPKLIHPGQKLWIPSSSGGTAPAAPESPAPAAPAPAPSGGMYAFGYGFQVDGYNGNMAGAAQATRDAGFGWVKVQVPWYIIEPDSKGVYSWGQVDEIVDRASGAGLRLMLSVVKAPGWARPGNTDWGVHGPPANPQDMADTMAALASRYKGRVHAIEVWNEQNLAYEWGNEPLDAGRYVELLCAVYRAVKAVDPNIAIISGGLTPTGVTAAGVSVDDLEYLRRMYAAGCRSCMDGLGAHPSGYNNPPDVRAGWSDPAEPSFKGHRSFYFQETMLSYRTVMNAYGDSRKLIWPTEFGWASSPSPVAGYEYAANVTESEQAAYLVKAFQLMRSWGFVGPAMVWNLNYNITAGGTELAQFGVQNRPAYAALRDMPK